MVLEIENVKDELSSWSLALVRWRRQWECVKKPNLQLEEWNRELAWQWECVDMSGSSFNGFVNYRCVNMRWVGYEVVNWRIVVDWSVEVVNCRCFARLKEYEIAWFISTMGLKECAWTLFLGSFVIDWWCELEYCGRYWGCRLKSWIWFVASFYITIGGAVDFYRSTILYHSCTATSVMNPVE